MTIPLKCDNCGINVGWKKDGFEISKKQFISCDNPECTNMVLRKVKSHEY